MEWQAMPLLAVRGAREMWRDWFAMAAMRSTARPAFVFDTFAVALEAAKAGAGVLLGSRPLIDAALALERAGAFAIVLEMIVPEIAEKITGLLSIPTIGIGSGLGCGGQVLVINDLIGLSTRPAPSFAKPKADVASIIRQAVESYVKEVKAAP